MVKLTGPLHAVNAAGSFAGSLIAQTWKGRTYMRKLTKPKQPRTAGQQAHRAIITFLSQLWAAISTDDKAAWAAAAATLNIPEYNAYMAYNLGNWQRGVYPAYTPAPPIDDPYTNVVALSASYANRFIQLSVQPDVSTYQLVVDAVGTNPPTPVPAPLYHSADYHRLGLYTSVADPKWYIAVNPADGLLRCGTDPNVGSLTDFFQGGTDLGGTWDGQGSYTGSILINSPTPDGYLPPAAAVAIFRSPSAFGIPTRLNLNVMTALDDAGTATIFDQPPTPGEWHYVAVAMSLDGRAAAQSSDVACTATE